MSETISITLPTPPATITVRVDFYNDSHRDLLLNSAAGSILKMAEFPKTISIPTVDLLTYFLFYKKRPGTPGYTSFQAVKVKYAYALTELDGLVQFSGGSIGAVPTAQQNTGTTERLGEALGLVVISQIHKLIDADWVKIDVANTKRKWLDYNYAASDGGILIKTEAKGSFCTDNRNKEPSVSQHKSSIDAKKKDERSLTPSNAILYGTIGALDSRTDGLAQCWLLDPPLAVEAQPREFRILARLTSIADLVSFVNPRAQVSSALKSRLAALRALRSIAELDSVPLQTGRGNKFSTETYSSNGRHNPFFARKSQVADGPAGGQVIQVDEKRIFFIGMREELLKLAIEQSFDAIESYRFEPGTVYKKVHCIVPEGRFQSNFSFAREVPVEIKKSGAYVHFDLEGYLHYSTGGIVFGVLPIPFGAKSKP